MKTILQIIGMRLKRGDTEILEGVDWQVSSGEHWVILGPNGCGKTSLLKSITGYMSASYGQLSLLGHTYGKCDWRDLKLHVGIVSSSLQTAIPAAEIAVETVISGRYAQLDLWARSTAVDRREALRWMRFFDISKLADRCWIFLSQGEKQRVLLARALMAKPKILMLDEPCAGLDPLARNRLLTFIERLACTKTSPSLVLVTHHVEEITPGFTHALLLRKGRVVASGRLSKALRSESLSTAFDAPVSLRKKGKRFLLRIHENTTLRHSKPAATGRPQKLHAQACCDVVAK